ncbi:MAG: hypothetical protein PUG70_04155 [Lachnospiraceae bacterium]|nr:hypothetical protein [Lachnospiraceae bacterium]MDY5521556.1 hypothetical protein [Agathobacter sp.]
MNIGYCEDEIVQAELVGTLPQKEHTLLKLDGIYANLYNTQAEYYK